MRILVSISKAGLLVGQMISPTEARELADQLHALADAAERPGGAYPKLVLPLPTGQIRIALQVEVDERGVAHELRA